MISILEHFDNLQEPIKKSYECLEDNGFLCITVPDSMKIIYDHEGRKFAFNHDLLNYEHIHHFNLQNLNFLLEKNKFELVNYRKVNRGIWDVIDVIFQKKKNQGHYKIKTEENYDAKSIVNYYKIKKNYYSSKFKEKIVKKKYSIYGCGWWTTCVLTNFFNINLRNLKFIMDKDKRKFNLKLFGKVIKSPKNLKLKNDRIIVSTLDSFDEIKKYLRTVHSRKIKLISFEENEESFLK